MRLFAIFPRNKFRGYKIDQAYGFMLQWVT
jgi:hypothetical protein